MEEWASSDAHPFASEGQKVEPPETRQRKGKMIWLGLYVFFGMILGTFTLLTTKTPRPLNTAVFVAILWPLVLIVVGLQAILDLAFN